ncbi:hypothetical protein F444_19984 [Phytophthora nicotianae P1976]|uniref:Uncharacterized protein n=1 Tax=Phytophthora nicotianae P1976 TaxID=1317066 RepID=A0A080Z609_PHYNI|nr:hypothetical protein F444_19984 [Phytophthora nicotianae P1976]
MLPYYRQRSQDESVAHPDGRSERQTQALIRQRSVQGKKGSDYARLRFFQGDQGVERCRSLPNDREAHVS